MFIQLFSMTQTVLKKHDSQEPTIEPFQMPSLVNLSLRTYLNHTTLTNNTICDISIKHLGRRQISRLCVDWGWAIIEAATEIPDDINFNTTKKAAIWQQIKVYKKKYQIFREKENYLKSGTGFFVIPKLAL